MEVEVEELDLGLLGKLVDLTNVLSRDSNFSRRVVPEQVDNLAGPVSVENVLKMEPERFLSHFRVPRQEDIFCKATLLPKDGNRAPDLHMTDQKAACNYHYLFSFAKVSDIAHIINASRIVARSGSIPHSAGNQSQLSLNPIQRPRRLRKGPLDQRRKPPTVNFLPDKVSIERQIPKILLVTGYQLEWISYLLLHPSESALAGRCQIITVGEIKAVLEVLFDILNHLNRLLRSALLD